MDLLLVNGCLWLVLVTYWYIAACFAKRTKSTESRLQRLQHTLPLGIGFFLVFHGGRHGFLAGQLFSAPWIRWTGMVLTVAGLGFAIWARFHLGRNWSGIITLKQDHELIRSGPYRFVRHPLYTGFLTALFGSALVATTGDALIGFLTVVIAIVFKLRREETLLTGEFGDQYRQFQREVPALVPFLI